LRNPTHCLMSSSSDAPITNTRKPAIAHNFTLHFPSAAVQLSGRGNREVAHESARRRVLRHRAPLHGVVTTRSAGCSAQVDRLGRARYANGPAREGRIWFACAVRALTKPCLTRCTDRIPCCSILLIGTKRMLGRLTASQIASASATSLLFRFHVWLHELRRHQPYRVPEALERTAPVMRTRTCLHPNHTRRQLHEVPRHLLTA
jgi:hypothetical protein